MTNLKLEGLKRILLIGAHSDDIEIGCGGFLLQYAPLLREQNIAIDWVVCTGHGSVRMHEAFDSYEAFTVGIENKTFQMLNFEDGLMLTERERMKQALTNLLNPDLVFTHYLEDRHQDHRFLAEMTHNAFRRSYVLEYEIIKYDWDLGNPNVFVRLTTEVMTRKSALLVQHFGSQRNKDWFDEETFRSLARVRGVQCHAQYAEGFYARKNVLTL